MPSANLLPQIVSFLFGLLLLVGCGTPAPEMIETNDAAGIIIPAAAADKFMRGFSGLSAEGYWTPGKEDVDRLEENLVLYLQQTPDARSPDLWQKLPDYKRQYVGLVEEGRRKILVNAFCDALGIDWQSVPVAIADGGDCYFDVKYDLASGAFSELYIHGES